MLRERRSNAGRNAARDALLAAEEANVTRRRVRPRVDYHVPRANAREVQMVNQIMKLNLQRILGVTTCNYTSDLVLLNARVDLIKKINATYYDSLTNKLLPLEVYTNGIIVKVHASKEYNVQEEAGGALLEYVTNDNILSSSNKIEKVYNINDNVKILNKEIRNLYASREFEVSIMTINPEICDICNCMELVEGISTVNIVKLAKLENSYIYLNNALKTYSQSKEIINDNNLILMNYVCLKCKTYIKDKKNMNNCKPQFSEAAGWKNSKLPDEFNDLTLSESSLCALIQPIITISGTCKNSGNVSFLVRDNDVHRIISELPHLPSELSILNVGREMKSSGASKKYAHLSVRKDKIWRFLNYLKDNNPEYSNITINQQRINELHEEENEGYITVREIDTETNSDSSDVMNPETQSHVGVGPAPDQMGADIEDSNIINVEYSGLINEGGNSASAASIAARLASIVDSSDVNANTLVNNFSAEQPPDNNGDSINVTNQPIVEEAAAVNTATMFDILIPYATEYTLSYKDKNFWCKAYPNLFTCIEGVSGFDYTTNINRNDKVSFSDWVKYLHRHSSGRFSGNITLPYALLNLKNRETAKGTVTYMLKNNARASNDFNNLTAYDIRQMALTNNHADMDKIGKYFNTFTESTTGSASYWAKRAKEATGLVQFLTNYENKTPILFHTGSMAEFHWQPLWRLIYIMYIKRGNQIDANIVEPLSKGCKTLAENNKRIYSILQEELVIINWFFTLRTLAWFKIVLENSIGVKDYWMRYEFAKSRGTIHFHSFMYSDSLSPLQNIFNLYEPVYKRPYDGDEDHFSNIMSQIDSFALDIVDQVKVHSGLCLSAEFPSSETVVMTTDSDVNDENNINKTRWISNRVKVFNYLSAVPFVYDAINDNLAKHYIKVNKDGSFSEFAELRDYTNFPPQEGSAILSPDKACLRCLLSSLVSQDDKNDNLKELLCRVAMHTCSPYCSRIDSKREGVKICGMGFGDINFAQPAKTDGKVLQAQASLAFKNHIFNINAIRDHPRLVQGVHSLTQTYQGNIDLQFILGPSNDLPKLSWFDPFTGAFIPNEAKVNDTENKYCERETLNQWINNYQNFNNIIDKNKYIEVCKKIMENTNILDRSKMMESIIHYIAGYCTKKEPNLLSPLQLLSKIISNRRIQDEDDITKLGKSFMNEVIKNRSVCKAEAVFLNIGLPSFHCSRECVSISLKFDCDRLLNMEADDRNDESQSILKGNAYTRYIKRDKNLENVSFDEYNRSKLSSKRKQYIAYSYCETKISSYPPSDRYIMSILKLHHPFRDSTDLTINMFDNFVNNMSLFPCPEYVVDDLRRAYARYFINPNHIQVPDEGSLGEVMLNTANIIHDMDDEDNEEGKADYEYNNMEDIGNMEMLLLSETSSSIRNDDTTIINYHTLNSSYPNYFMERSHYPSFDIIY